MINIKWLVFSDKLYETTKYNIETMILNFHKCNSQIILIPSEKIVYEENSIYIVINPYCYYFPLHLDKIYYNNSNISGVDTCFAWDFDMDRGCKIENNIGVSGIGFNSTIMKKILDIGEINTITELSKYIGIIKNTGENISLIEPEFGYISFSNKINQNWYERKMIAHTFISGTGFITTDFIKNIIDIDVYDKYYNYNVSSKKNIIEPDVIYWLGVTNVKFDPEFKNLGGSEQGVVNVSEYLAKKGMIVHVYGNFKNFEMKQVNNVYYFNWYYYDYSAVPRNLIIWRHLGLVSLKYLPVKWLLSNNLSIDLQDCPFLTFDNKFTKEELRLFFDNMHKICVKSQYHKDLMILWLKTITEKDCNDNIIVIPNGVRIDDFTQQNNFRIKNRFCYCSSYDRGLEWILENIWSKLYEKLDNAEFHIYYGMEYLDKSHKNKLQFLMGQEGVIDHGRKNVDIIAKEKSMSTFQLYLSKCQSETDCISVKESLVAGCIPIMFDWGVFKEREGIKFNPDDDIDNIVNKIVAISNNEELTNNIRDIMKKSDTIISWDNVGLNWLDNVIYVNI